MVELESFGCQFCKMTLFSKFIAPNNPFQTYFREVAFIWNLTSQYNLTLQESSIRPHQLRWQWYKNIFVVLDVAGYFNHFENLEIFVSFYEFWRYFQSILRSKGNLIILGIDNNFNQYIIIIVIIPKHVINQVQECYIFG